jgi:minor extracellular serine protease Vpr
LPGSQLPDIGIPVALRMDSDGPLVDLFLELRDASAAGSLQQYGFQQITEVNGILLGSVPLAQLEALLRDESVAFVEVAMNRMPFNDRALQDTGVPLLHAGTGISSPFRGNGVLIGVLDTGIDFTHPDFSTEAGTKIRYLLDMKVDGTNREWSKAQIDANPGSISQRDGDGGGGHGTHVAGTAAGNGRLNANYIGVAPEAELLIVKGVRDDRSDGGFADTDVVTGVQWMFDKAQALGRPAVVNLSLGGNYGPMDGTSLYEQSISNLSGQGRIIVAAAGNKGNDYIHVGGTLTQGNLPYEAVLYTVSDAYNYVEAWYDRGAVARVRLAYYSVSAQDELVFEGITPSVNMGSKIGFSGNRLAPEPIRHNGEIIGYYAIDASVTNDTRNGDGNIQLLITDNDTSVDLSEYIWSVIVIPGASAGRFDMWFTDGEFAGSAIGFDDSRELVGNTNYTVGAPSTARKVISVGSYVTRSRWTDIDGRSWISQNSVPNELGSREPVFGDRSEFSSKGPTRDGRYAPDIMAPGEKITSALSSHLTLQSDRETYSQQGGVMRFEVAQGGNYMLTQGTSMASPHVAGVVALMLQAYPELDYDGVVDILTRTARRDSQTRAVPNNLYGYGKVDAYSAVLEAAATNPVSIETDELAQLPDEITLHANYPNPFNPTTVVPFSLPASGPVRLDVFDATGRKVQTLVNQVLSSGRHQVSVDATSWASGMYVYVLQTPEVTLTRKMLLIK